MKNLGTLTSSLWISFIRYTLRVCTCISHCSIFFAENFSNTWFLGPKKLFSGLFACCIIIFGRYWWVFTLYPPGAA